jgi:hypothetical protein
MVVKSKKIRISKKIRKIKNQKKKSEVKRDDV